MKKQRFLFTLLMAIVMMAMSPTRAWAQDIAAHLSISGRDAAVNFNGDPTTEPISSTVYLYEGEQVTVYLDVIFGPSVACFPVGNTTIGESGLSELALSDSNKGKFTVTTEGQYTFTLSNGRVGIEPIYDYIDEVDDDGIVTGSYQMLTGYQVTNANVTLGVVYQSHTHVYDQEVVKDEALITAPTCTTKGSYYCSCICGELSSEQTFEVPSLGHHLVRSNILASAATCTKDAEYKAMCDREGCDFVSETMTFTAYFTALGHQWADSGDGEHHACQREGCEAQEAHSWHSGECVVCQATDPNFVEVNIVDSSGGFNNEKAENLFDGAPSTKWCSEGIPYADSEEVQFYVIFHPTKPYALTSYTLVDAGDSDEHQNRKWSSWRIEGTNDLDSETWEDVDSREESYSNKTFTTGCTSVYAYYKLSVFASGFEEPENEYGGDARLIQQMADMNITWSCVHQWGEDGKCTVCGMDECNLSGHDYQVQLDENKKPVFVWSEDCTTATLQLVCSHNAEHTSSVDADMESWVNVPATCTTPGMRIYHATVEYDEKTYADYKNVEIAIDPNAHDIGTRIDLPDVDYEDIITYLDRQDLMPETSLTIRCKQCNEEIYLDDTEVISAYSITYGITMNPVCSMNGYYSFNLQIKLSSEDGISFSETGNINPLGHSYGEEMSLCSDGYHHYVCTREECGDQSEDKYAKMFGAFREVTDDDAPTETIQLTKVGNYYYASLYTDFPYVVGGDDVAYYVTSAENGVVTLDNTAYVRAGSGVIFRSTNSECTIEYDPEGFQWTAPEDNLLTGSDEAFVPNANQYAFGLSNEGYLGFWNWTGMTIPAWKAYLDLSDEPSAARGFRIVFDDEPNGIREIPANSLNSGHTYDLMGRRVNNKFKGIIIVDGKKVYVPQK